MDSSNLRVDSVAPSITSAVTNDTDFFYGLDQNITLLISATETFATAYIDLSDLNSALTGYQKMNPLGGNQYNINIGRGWTGTSDFTIYLFDIIVTDTSDNNSIASSMTSPAVIYDMNQPAGTDGNTTNFQNITNFEHVFGLTFQIAGQGQIMFPGDLNLMDSSTTDKLEALDDYMDMATDADANESYIYLDSEGFNDLNQPAYISFYGLTYPAQPNILVGDINCGSLCSNITYDVGLGQLDLNVLHFSRYTTVYDFNGPDFNLSMSSTTSSGTTINVVIDENATCKYDTNSELTYDTMTGTASTLGTTATFAVTSLSASTSYTYYIYCRDRVGYDSNKSVSVTTSAASTDPETSGGSTYIGGTSPYDAPAGTPTTISSTKQTYTPTAEQIEEILADAGLSPREMNGYKEAAANGQLKFERELKIEKIQTGSNVAYKSTFTLRIKNTSGKNLKDITIVETIPKKVAEHASLIDSSYEFRILKADPVIEFIIPVVNAGQDIEITYSVDKAVSEDVLEEMSSPVGKFAEATEPPADQEPDDEPATPPVVDDTVDTTPGDGVEETAQPMDYTLLIVAIIVIVIVGAAYMNKDKLMKMMKK